MRLQAGLCPALTEEVVGKLRAAGVKNLVDFMLKDPELLASESNVSYKDLLSIRRIIQAHYAAFPVTGADLLQESLRTAVVISTGNDNLNELLGGGMMSGELVEVVGCWGSGKSSLCVHLAVHTAHRLGFQVLYVDPLAALTPPRISSFLESLTAETQAVEQALSRIKVATPTDIWELFQVLDSANQMQITMRYESAGPSSSGGGGVRSDRHGRIRLLIVDSFLSLISPLLATARTEGWGIINQLASTLKQLATEQHMVVVVVNNVVQANCFGKVDETEVVLGKWKPALGRFWLHVPNTRLFVEKDERSEVLTDQSEQGSSELRLNVTILKSTRLQAKSSKVSLSPAGVLRP